MAKEDPSKYKRLKKTSKTYLQGTRLKPKNKEKRVAAIAAKSTEFLAKMKDEDKKLIGTVMNKLSDLRLLGYKDDDMIQIHRRVKRALKPKEAKDAKTKSDKPLSDYIIFTQSERAKVKEEFPDMSPKEVMKELGTRWQQHKDGKL